MVARRQTGAAGRPTLNPDALMMILAAREQALRVMPAKTIKVVHPLDANKFTIDGTPVGDASFDAVCDFLGAPTTFMRRAPLGVAQAVVSGMMKESRVEESELVFNATANTVVGHRPRGTELVPATRVFEKLFAALPETDGIYFHDTAREVEASIVCRSLDIEPKKGDVVRGGISCLYSEVDAKRSAIRAYSERLVCTNGMTHREFDYEFGLPNGEGVGAWLDGIGSAVASCLEFASASLEPQLRRATEFELDGPQAIRRIFKQSRLPAKYMDAVLAAHAIEGDGTAFGVLQAFTRAANALKHEARVRLQAVAGDELSVIEKAHCPRCYALM